LKIYEKKHDSDPPEGQEINWSPRGALLINVFFGWELLGIPGSSTGSRLGVCQNLHKKIKDVPERTPGKVHFSDTFSPDLDPPGGPKKCTFFHFFLTFPHFPSISVEESLCKIRNREIHRNDVPWYVKPKKALFPTFSQESDNSDPGSRIQDLTQKILRRKNIQIPDLNNSLPKNLLGEKISLVRDQSNLEDPS